jgi:hypothetical protein
MDQLLWKPQIRSHLSSVGELLNHKLDNNLAAHSLPVPITMGHPLQIAARINSL